MAVYALAAFLCVPTPRRRTQAIDEHVDTRRKRRREAAQIEAMKKEREDRPKISDQFADLKVHSLTFFFVIWILIFTTVVVGEVLALFVPHALVAFLFLKLFTAGRITL